MPFVQSQVWQLKVQCTEAEEGCKWTDQFGTDGRNLKSHHAVCDNIVVTCSLCKNEMQRKEASAHEPVCTGRRVECVHCAQEMKWSEILTHQSVDTTMQQLNTGSFSLSLADDQSTPSTDDAEMTDVNAVGNGVASSSAAAASSSSAAAASVAVQPRAVILRTPLIPCRGCESCPRQCEDITRAGSVE